METITQGPPVFAGSPTDNYLRHCREHVWSSLTPGQQAVLTTLASYACWRCGVSRPAVTTIAKKVGLDRGHVSRLMKQLVAEGAIKHVGWKLTSSGNWVKKWLLVGYDRFVDFRTEQAYTPRNGEGDFAAKFADVKIHLADAPARHESDPEPKPQQQIPEPSPVEPEADQLLAANGVTAAADRKVLIQKHRPTAARLAAGVGLIKRWTGKPIRNFGGWWSSFFSGMFDSRLQQAVQKPRTATQPLWMTRWSSVAVEVRNRVLDDLLALPRISQSDRRHFTLVREGKARPTQTLASIVLERVTSC